MPPSTNYDPADPGSYVPPDLPPAPTSVASRFVSETTLEAAKIQREADWKAAYARLGQEPPKKEEEDGEKYDGRSLWEKLQEHKDKKQEAFDEQLKFKNQFRALDEDEISFLDSLTDDNHEEEAKKAQAIKDELKGFREAVISRQSAIPPPVISSSLSPSIAVASISPTASSISLQKATAPSAAPPKKPAAGTAGGSKKKDFQKKFLAGVVVKKKPQHHATGVSPNAGKRSAEEGKEGESATEAKKRKVREGETGA